MMQHIPASLSGDFVLLVIIILFIIAGNMVGIQNQINFICSAQKDDLSPVEFVIWTDSNV